MGQPYRENRLFPVNAPKIYVPTVTPGDKGFFINQRDAIDSSLLISLQSSIVPLISMILILFARYGTTTTATTEDQLSFFNDFPKSGCAIPRSNTYTPLSQHTHNINNVILMTKQSLHVRHLIQHPYFDCSIL